MEILYCDNCGSKVAPTNALRSEGSGREQVKLYCPNCAPLFEHTSSALLQIAVPPSVYEQATAVMPVIPDSALPAPYRPVVTKFYFCEACGKRITDKQILEGHGRDKKVKGFYCKHCAEGVATVEFEALKEPESEPEPPRAAPAPQKTPEPVSPPRPVKPPKMVSQGPLQNSPKNVTTQKNMSASAIPWIAGAAALGLALYLFFGRAHNQPPAHEEISGKSEAPMHAVAAPPIPTGALPSTVTAPSPGTLATEKTSIPTSYNGALTTLKVDFQRETPPPGGDGFETAANPPAGSSGHPMRLMLHLKGGGSSAGVDVTAFLANVTGQKARFVEATATSVVRVRVYADAVGAVGANLLEGGVPKWHGFGYRGSFSKQHEWTTLEFPLSQMVDEKNQPVKAGLQIGKFGVFALGTKAGYSLWIDEMEILPRPMAADEKP